MFGIKLFIENFVKENFSIKNRPVSGVLYGVQKGNRKKRNWKRDWRNWKASNVGIEVRIVLLDHT